ncbi:OmpL47-type beta-barrel domain-containing protein [Paenibacillus sp. NRS-1783]|uniref:OmpL47-type beta-barrel domain-containing protein n=1 Tax=Paenibacillus sp. NRS-1783 TaxID=3233907 RepID=UPI003D2CE6C7
MKRRLINVMLALILGVTVIPIYPEQAAAASYYVGQKWEVTNVGSSYTFDLGAPGFDRKEFGLAGEYYLYTPSSNGDFTWISYYYSQDGVTWYKDGDTLFKSNSGSFTGGLISTDKNPSVTQIRYLKLESNKSTTTFSQITVKMTEGPYSNDTIAPTKPTIQLSPNGVTRGNVQVTITGSTDDRLLRGYEYKLVGATNQDWTSGDSLTITNEGNTTIYARAVDYNYNRSSETTALARIDRSPPGAPALYPNRTGYVNTDVAVTIQHGADTGGGIRGSQFKLSGATSQDWGNYSGPVNIQNHGITTITARTLDNDGRIGAESSIPVYIDKVAPSAPTITPTGSHGNGYTLTLQQGTDDSSGVAHTQYRISGALSQDWKEYDGAFPVQADGKSTVYARSIDQAGNISLEAKVELTIDKKGPTAPEIRPSEIGPTVNNIIVSISPGADPVYGIKTTQYRTSPAAAWQPYTSPFTVTAEGVHQLSARTMNNLDVSSPVVTKSVIIDRTQPSVPEITLSEITAATKYTNKPIQFTISGGSDSSDFHYEYRINSGSHQTGASGTINESGTITVTAQAVDAAGNRSDPVSAVSYIDREAPTIQVTPSSQDWSATPIDVELRYDDQHAGVDPATIQYQVTHSKEVPELWKSAAETPVRLKLADEGEWYVHARVSDRAGNSFTQSSQALRVQRLPEPVTLSVLSVSNTETELQWSLPSGLTDGYIYTVRNLTTGQMWDVAHPGNTFKDTGLQGGHRYEYEVQSSNHVGNTYSNRVSVLTLPDAPEDIRIRTVSRSPSRITADITPVLSADRYHITAADVLTGQIVYQDTVTEDVYNPITNLEPGRIYDIAAAAINSTGAGAAKHVSFLSLPDNPGGFREAIVKEDAVLLKWNTVATATYYQLNRDDVSVYHDVYTEFDDIGLRSGTEYQYGVAAENMTGAGDYSRLGIITLPAPVTTLARVSSDVYSVGVVFEDVYGADGYLLNANDGPDIRVSRGMNQYQFEGLPAGTLSNLRIRPYNRSGIGRETSITAMTAPESVASPEAVDLRENRATIRWQPVHGATTYKITIDDQVYYSTLPEVRVTGLQPGTGYPFTVSSGNSGGYSPPTSGSLLTLPGQVQHLQVKELGNGKIQLSWDAVQSAENYNVSRQDADNVVQTQTNTVVLSDIQPGIIYSFGVQAENASGTGEITPLRYRALPSTVPSGSLSLEDVTDTGMTAMWKEAPGADGYNVYQDGAFAGYTTDLNYKLGKMDSSTFYTVTVAPVNTTGEGKVATATEETLPSPDFRVTKSETSKDDFYLEWVSDHKNDVFVLTGDTKELYRSKGRSFTWTGLREGKTYTLDLWAENSQGKRTKVLAITEKTRTSAKDMDNGSLPGVSNVPEAKTDQTPTKTTETETVKKKHFDDIDRTFNRDKINALADIGVVQGTSDTTFEPSRPVTRVEYAAMLVRALQLDPAPSESLTFDDIDRSAWYVDPLKAAIKDEVARGFSSTIFAPDRIINREQAAKMTNNVVRAEPQQAINAYTDTSRIVAWAKEDVLGLTQSNLVQGYPDGSFRPKQDITRAEAAEVIYNMLIKQQGLDATSALLQNSGEVQRQQTD